MSANAANIAPTSPARRHGRRFNLAAWVLSVAAALGLGLLLAGASASDVSDLSDALGVPVETSALPALG